MTDGGGHTVARLVTPVFVLCAAALVLLLTFAVLFGLNGPPLGEALTDAALLGALAGLDLAMLRVRIATAPTSVVLHNLVSVTRLPLTSVVRVGAEEGLTFEALDGLTYRTITCQSSVLGGLTGYRRAHRLAEQLRPLFSPDSAAPARPERHRTLTPLWLALGGAAVGALLCLIARLAFAGA